MSPFGPKRHFAAARQFGRFRTDADIGLDFMSTRPRTIGEIGQRRPDGLIITNDYMLFDQRRLIAELALANRLPTMAFAQEFTAAGTLMSYGANISDLVRRAALYIDKILRGAKPSELPVEQPTKFDLVINLKTAKALGLPVPHNLLVLADEVIE